MSINLKAFHRESNLLFNKVDITVPTLENNIYSRQKCEIKPQIKEWKAVGKNLQDIKKKVEKIGKSVGFTDSWLLQQTRHTLFFCLFCMPAKTILTIMWFSASRLKLTSAVSPVIDWIIWVGMVWPWRMYPDLGQNAPHAHKRTYTKSSRGRQSSTVLLPAATC